MKISIAGYSVHGLLAEAKSVATGFQIAKNIDLALGQQAMDTVSRD